MPFVMCRAPRFAVASTFALLSALAPASRSVADPAPPFAALLQQSQVTAPRLAEAVAGVRQSEGLARQAAARPNPTASLGAENFSGSGAFRGYDQAETTVSIEQPLELGGKRAARITAGRAGIEAARARLERARADFGFDLALAYAEADVAERQATLAEENVALALEDLRVAKALVEAGRVAELNSYQAQAAVSAAHASLDAARAVRAETLARLTALSGSSALFTSLSEDLLARPAGPAPVGDLDVTRSPLVLAVQAERDEVARRVRVEQTRAIPDITASLGYRRFAGDDSHALVGGVSVALPLFDQNRGNVAAVRGELAAADARMNAARLDAMADGRSALFQIEAAQSRAASAQLGEQAAGEAYRLTRIAYESGKSPLSDLTNARRGLAEARAQTLDAQLSRIRAEAGLARLLGRAPFGVN
jgi:cobalt-zinc-cadmium efflux system outer membrane protein